MDRETFFALLKPAADGCLEWSRGRNSKGYGYVRFDGADHRTHRLAFELVNGAIPPGLLVLHRCDNPPCCNPAHLVLGTHADNQRDKVAKRRHAPQDGAANNAARIDAQQVAEIRRLRAAGEPVRAVAALFHIHPTTVSKVTTGASWRQS